MSKPRIAIFDFATSKYEAIHPLGGITQTIDASDQDGAAGGKLINIASTVRGLPMPDTVVSADDIREGKPNPGCYLLALDRLGQRPEHAVVFEDAPAGIAAGIAAGCRTIAISGSTHATADASVPSLVDFTRLTLEKIDDASGLHLRVVPA